MEDTDERGLHVGIWNGYSTFRVRCALYAPNAEADANAWQPIAPALCARLSA
jgi:hypothetical protein